MRPLVVSAAIIRTSPETTATSALSVTFGEAGPLIGDGISDAEIGRILTPACAGLFM